MIVDLFPLSLEDFFTRSFETTQRSSLDKDQNLVFTIEMPGFKREEINIVSDEALRSIMIEATSQSKKNCKRLYVDNVYDLALATAKLDLGILTLTIPRSTTSERKKIIKVT